MTKFSLLLAAGAAAVSSPAEAVTYSFTVSGGATGNGLIEATPFSATAATVTGISGFIDNVAITGLLRPGSPVNDNVLRFGDDVKLTSAGISFMAGMRTDLFYNFGVNSYRVFQTSGPIRSINFTLQEGAVPEPAAWAMMLAGFLCVGATVRRRRTSVSFAAA